MICYEEGKLKNQVSAYQYALKLLSEREGGYVKRNRKKGECYKQIVFIPTKTGRSRIRNEEMLNKRAKSD